MYAAEEGERVVRRLALAAVAAVGVSILAGCSSEIPKAPPMPTLEAGTWVSVDGQYSITLEQNPNEVHIVLPDIFDPNASRDCVTTGDYPPKVSADGSWATYGEPPALGLDFRTGAGLHYGLIQAREGDWAVIEDQPCGPDSGSLYLVRQEATAPSP